LSFERFNTENTEKIVEDAESFSGRMLEAPAFTV